MFQIISPTVESICGAGWGGVGWGGVGLGVGFVYIWGGV